VQRNSNRPFACKVEHVIDETPTVRTLVFSDDVLASALPGQFAMVWIPGFNELPMSIMPWQENGKAAFTIRKHGTASTALYNVGVGELIGVRGPYGNSFEVKGNKLLLIGGGTGLVPLMRLISNVDSSAEITLLIGAKIKNEVFFEELANTMLSKNSLKQVIVTTEDGSYGKKGLVTEHAEKLMNEKQFDGVYTCGPEIMMYKLVQLAVSKGIFIQASLERMMKCGIGICGSCCMNEDLVCRDGTVFDGQHLLSNNEFGHHFRNKSGMLENY